MPISRIDRRVLTDASWWHWVVTIPFLILYLSGVWWAIAVASALCVVAIAYFFSHLRAVKPYPVQIRIVYLAWMLVGVLPWMGWMHWIQLAGTSAMVTVGYCPLARLLNLLPLNRSGPLTWCLVHRTFFRDPCAGGFFRLSVGAATPGAACSVQTPGAGALCSLSDPEPSEENRHTERVAGTIAPQRGSAVSADPDGREARFQDHLADSGLHGLSARPLRRMS